MTNQLNIQLRVRLAWQMETIACKHTIKTFHSVVLSAEHLHCSKYLKEHRAMSNNETTCKLE